MCLCFSSSQDSQSARNEHPFNTCSTVCLYSSTSVHWNDLRYPMSPRRGQVPFSVWFLSRFLVLSGSFSLPLSHPAPSLRIDIYNLISVNLCFMTVPVVKHVIQLNTRKLIIFNYMMSLHR